MRGSRAGRFLTELRPRMQAIAVGRHRIGSSKETPAVEPGSRAWYLHAVAWSNFKGFGNELMSGRCSGFSIDAAEMNFDSTR